MSSVIHVLPADRNIAYDHFNISPATLCGNLLLMSGLIGLRADGSIADTLQEQIELIFRQAESILDEVGGTFADIASFETYHVGEVTVLDQMTAFMEVRDRHVQRPGPAWTSLGVSSLAIPGTLIEVKIVAYIGRPARKSHASQR
jgi:enamine deaminase RidA (YjgF/YER057c/UK114 family)